MTETTTGPIWAALNEGLATAAANINNLLSAGEYLNSKRAQYAELLAREAVDADVPEQDFIAVEQGLAMAERRFRRRAAIAHIHAGAIKILISAARQETDGTEEAH